MKTPDVRIPISLVSAEFMPIRAHETDAGFDVFARAFKAGDYEVNVVPLLPGERTLALTGIYLGIPKGWEAQVRPRSGMALKTGVTVLNAPGTIDAGYRNEVGVILINLGTEPVHFNQGNKVAQLVFKKVPEVKLMSQLLDNLDETDRGLGGFGSTGE